MTRDDSSCLHSAHLGSSVPDMTVHQQPTIGSLCSGYGGLDMAVEEFFGARTAWFAEYETAPSKVLAHHWPSVPNYGDMTQIDWATVPKVDIVTGGTPCQDLSAAGRRRGMTEGTRSNLWVQMRECIAAVRPSVVVWENVEGAYSACAESEVDSELGRCPRCVDRDSTAGHAPNLRALHRVLGDLASLGFDAEWVRVRASDAGAPHQRKRVFVVAVAAEDADVAAGGEWRFAAPGQAESRRARADAGRRGGTPARDADIAGLEGRPVRRGSADQRPAGSDGVGTQWGAYEPAIRRWERVLGRVAPAPTNPDGKGGAHRLAPQFVEWMMGLPAGHVTDPAIGITRNEQLKALGNGVVPQQAHLALSLAWPRLADVRQEMAA